MLWCQPGGTCHRRRFLGLILGAIGPFLHGGIPDASCVAGPDAQAVMSFSAAATAVRPENAFAACAVNTLRGSYSYCGRDGGGRSACLVRPSCSTYWTTQTRAALNRCSPLLSRGAGLTGCPKAVRDWGLGKGFRKTELMTDLLRIAFLPPLARNGTVPYRAQAGPRGANRGAGEGAGRWLARYG